MENIIKFLYEFVCFFAVFYIIEIVFIDKRKRNFNKLKKNDEIKLFVKRYNLDLTKTDYFRVRKTLYLINSFILSFTTLIIINIKNNYLQVLFCIIIVLTLMYSLFEIFGRKFKREENIE